MCIQFMPNQLSVINHRYLLIIPMDPSPEYITTRLTDILISLQNDIERATIKHKNQVLNLMDVIQIKDREIKQLQEEVESLRRSVITPKTIDVQTASFKKITLGKRTPKNVSQFNSDASTSVQMVQSVLMEQQRSNRNNQTTKNIQNLQKMESCNSLKSLKSAINVQTPKNTNNQKQNIQIRPKKPSIPNVNMKPQRFSSNTSSSKSNQRSAVKPISDKKEQSRQKRKLSKEKRCINVMIPSVNFSAYSIGSKIKQPQHY